MFQHIDTEHTCEECDFYDSYGEPVGHCMLAMDNTKTAVQWDDGACRHFVERNGH